jgi:transcriptional regulator with XRE-family HTH domain
VSQSPGGRNISGKRIAEARGAARPPLTQEDLSGKLALHGVQLDRAAIAKVENDLRRVLDYELKAFAAALDVRVDWLLGGKK